jgi:hypothetical protein
MCLHALSWTQARVRPTISNMVAMRQFESRVRLHRNRHSMPANHKSIGRREILPLRTARPENVPPRNQGCCVTSRDLLGSIRCSRWVRERGQKLQHLILGLVKMASDPNCYVEANDVKSNHLFSKDMILRESTAALRIR